MGRYIKIIIQGKYRYTSQTDEYHATLRYVGTKGLVIEDIVDTDIKRLLMPKDYSDSADNIENDQLK